MIGIYGTRNVCTLVYEAGYAVASFVSDMSTGYSGNMGFMIPPNWNYDQYAEITVETAVDGEWAIGADADAIKIAELISESTSRTHSFSEVLRNYYSNYAEDRFRYLIDDIECKPIGRWISPGGYDKDSTELLREISPDDRYVLLIEELGESVLSKSYIIEVTLYESSNSSECWLSHAETFC